MRAGVKAGALKRHGEANRTAMFCATVELNLVEPRALTSASQTSLGLELRCVGVIALKVALVIS